MIECTPGSAMPICQRSLASLLAGNYWHVDQALRFDPDYIAALPQLHGAHPLRPYFRDSRGHLRRIGWFVTMTDLDSDLAGPTQVDHMYHDSDTRIIDRSLIYLLDGESSIYRPLEDSPMRMYPLAALHSDPLDDSEPISLCWHFGYGNDCVCFDTSTDPISVVVCEFERAMAAYVEYDSAPENKYDYSFLIPVAASFADFARMLTVTPTGN
ncbi:MAG: hypothetical protein KDB14_33630 [Planctomycetales bacterium]|nr:hypothetical protein [Planctomycetales bacterium]